MFRKSCLLPLIHLFSLPCQPKLIFSFFEHFSHSEYQIFLPSKMPSKKSKMAKYWTVNQTNIATAYVKPAIFLALGLISLIVIAFIGHHHMNRSNIGTDAHHGNHVRQRGQGAFLDDHERYISEILARNILGENIKENLRRLTRKPHPAGTAANLEVAQFIKDEWTKQGLANVHFAEYSDVLLSHPQDYDKPNKVDILDKKNRLIFRALGQELPLIADEQSDYGANFTFNAYSASGTATGELVYANYGTVDDFEYLDSQNISVKDRLVIIRYGYVWRGQKVLAAQLRGASGVILYSDPADVSPNVTEDEQRYPHTVWMPSRGVQRGSLLNFDGDPLTPFFPALNYTFRSRNFSELLRYGVVPSIPVQPIGYADASQLLSRLKGPKAPEKWNGGLNITYRLGPGLAQPAAAVRLTVKTNTTAGHVIRNVIGYIEGRREPDRYVILGNHYDAWVYGAIDPNSATATLMEVSRSFMKAINESGWRPLRTIVFCAWDAEEYGLLGSTEYVEQHRTLLDRRTVAYLNVDLISGNETLEVQANPTLYGAAVTAAKRVKNPDPSEISEGRRTVYDTWVRKRAPDIIRDIPQMPAPAGGSDHVPFFRYLGVPVANFRYKNLSLEDYPLYHTIYETKFVEEKLLDPNNFAFHTAVGRFWAELAHILADRSLLPLNVDDYAIVLQRYTDQLKARLSGKGLFHKIKGLQDDVLSLRKAEDEFQKRAVKFHDYAEDFHRISDLYAFDMFNSRLAQVERCFVDQHAAPANEDPSNFNQRHVVYGTSSANSYEATNFPFVYEATSRYEKAETDEEKFETARQLRHHISVLHYSVDCATDLLKKFPVRHN